MTGSRGAYIDYLQRFGAAVETPREHAMAGSQAEAEFDLLRIHANLTFATVIDDPERLLVMQKTQITQAIAPAVLLVLEDDPDELGLIVICDD